MWPSPSKSPHAATRVSTVSARPTASATSSNRPWSCLYKRFGRPRKPTNSSRSPSLSKSAHALAWPPLAEKSSGWTSAKRGDRSAAASAVTARIQSTAAPALRAALPLFRSKRFERHNACGTTGGKVTREQRCGRQDHDGGRQNERIERAHAVQQPAHELTDAGRHHHPDRQADDGRAQALADDELADVCSRGAERHPDADLARPPRHVVRRQT